MTVANDLWNELRRTVDRDGNAPWQTTLALIALAEAVEAYRWAQRDHVTSSQLNTARSRMDAALSRVTK